MKIFPEEQKGYKRNSRGTEDQLLSEKAVLRDCKRRREREREQRERTQRENRDRDRDRMSECSKLVQREY